MDRRRSINPEDEERAAMANAIMLPITSFDTSKPRLDGREERLRAILKNINAHHQTVRANIVSSAMKSISTKEPPPQPADHITSLLPVLKSRPMTPNPDDLLARPEDLDVSATGLGISTSGSGTPTTRLQSSSSPAMSAALKTLTQIEAYDKHVAGMRARYERRLPQEENGGQGVAGASSRRNSVASKSPAEMIMTPNPNLAPGTGTSGFDRDDGRPSAPTAAMSADASGDDARQSVPTAPTSAGAVGHSVDAARDPRRRR
ncbi:hypothetical protein H2203_009083 [Taxawa tesnikishii (nom. ined.)]|nr:hypothetical protein H2203_009083 [Dothideales sp. JES 119]